MSASWIRTLGYLSIAGLAAVFVVWTINVALAQDEPLEPEAIDNVSAIVAYQGRLTDAGGKPLSGEYEMRFYAFPTRTGGTSFWNSGLRTIDVVDGLFKVNLGLRQSDLTGQPFWFEIHVNGEVLSPRQPLQAAAYALSLQPGAQVEQNASGDGLTVRNVSTGYAVRGEAPAGVGMAGHTDDGYGVYGYDGGGTQARGYGGYFYSENGTGAFGYSNGALSPQNAWAPGLSGYSANGVGVFGQSNSAATYMSGVRGENTGTGFGGYFTSENGVPLKAETRNGPGNAFEIGAPFGGDLVFRVDMDGNVFADGPYSSAGADVAELLPAADGLEPGDVLVVGADGVLTRSSKAYQPTVVGVYSTKPSLIGGVREGESQDGKAPLAIVGVVPVKVSAENGPISAGDLLTTAGIPGHAMRCAEVELCFGRSLGKALEDLPAGTGTIQALITLQ